MHKSIRRLFIHTAVGFCVLLMPIAISAKEASAKAAEISWQWQYDRDGRLDKIIAPGNVITRISHTESGGENDKKLTTIISTGSEQRRFMRDNQGHLLSAAGAGGITTFTRNSIGLPTEARSNNAPTLYYKYDMQNRLVEMAIGKSTTIKYRYDFLGRLSAVSTPAGEITYEYHRAENTVVRRLPNGLQTFRKYDGEGRLIELIHADANNKAIAAYAYDYRPDGLIAAISESSQRTGTRVCRYAYNLMHRLTNVECGGKGHSFRYNYDSLGNLSEQASEGQVIHFTSTPAGALATDSRGAAHVDERGHIRKLPHYSGQIGYDFNDFGELTAVSSKSVHYTYNAFGLLTSRTVDGRKTQYLPDPFADAWQPIWRRDTGGAEAIIIWDGALPLLELRGKEARYRLEDHLGSVRIEINGKGDVLAWHDYTPYGEPKEANNSNDIVPAFAGLFWDPVANVYLAKARAYDPVTARFLQPDPQLRVPGASKHSHSLYAYSGGDPVNYIDRDGAEAVPYETVGFNHNLRWSDNYLRALDYHSFGWLRKIFNIDAPLVVNTAPDIRDSVVRQILDAAWKTSEDIDALDQKLKLWRKGNVPEELKNTFITEQEWQAAENYTTALYEVNKFDHALGSVGRGLGSAWTVFLAGGWLRLKTISSALGIPPFFDKNQQWVPSTIGTLRWQAQGIVDAWDSRYKAPPKPFFQRIDDFIARPAYGDEILVNSNRISPSPVGGANLDMPQSGGVLFSTTGPGKRGGRGGGITRPPSWKPPGSQGHLPPGPQPPLGGHPPLGSGGRSMSMAPSPVGGVYLGGGARLLEDLGQIAGIAVDGKTGKLALIGSNNLQIDLPPLRMDDVVTIFRAVYDYGESPSVTIDPDERNPKGPAMNVKHGPGTEDTYVGWVLFECDRIMKTYQLGKDNVTKKDVLSGIKGYTDILNAVYFGNESNRAASGASGADSAPKETWERFWIVPASLKRFDAQTDDLSLLEISLKVNTQKMQWKDGKLIDDEKGASSYGANAFKTWFSDHYDEIADEVYLTPPAESGFKKPVAIFHELRRIALIAAIAEHLRNSGQGMPGWMRDYTVKPFHVSKTTPSLSIRKSRQYDSAAGVSSIYGGVNLAPADKDMHAFKETAKTSTVSVPKEHINFVKLARQEAASLSPKIPELILANEAVGKVQAIQTADKKTYNAAILPGANTMALAPNRQAVTDMDIPIGLGRSISLSRYYNSFFNPSGELGAGWTLNLPRLLMTRIPVKRDGMQSQYRVVPHLINPLGTLDIRFNKVKRVEPYPADMFAAEDHLEAAGIVEGPSAIIGAKTHLALFRDGTEWHFDDGGRLVLVQAEGAATRYVRDSEGRIMQIVGYIGKNAVADIKLAYDSQGRITEARAQQADFLKKQAPAEASEVAFKYGADGRLSSVISSGSGQNEAPHAAWTYSYESNHLTKITGADGIDVSYGYDERGQLLWEKQGNQKRQFTLKTSPQGTVLTSAADNASEQPNKWSYDIQMRPLKAELGGGRTIQWQYGQDNAVSETAYQDGKLILTRTTSQDGKSEKTILASGAKYEVHKDNFGKPTTFLIDGALATKANWQANGSFAGLRTGNTEIQTLRHKEGWPNGLLISTPMESGKTDQWLEYEWDIMGRPVKITDSSGLNYLLYYDEQGRIKTFGQLTKDSKLSGAKILYNKDGLITDIESTWEKEKREYTSSGILKSITVKREGAQSKSIFDAHGRLANQSAFDKGETIWQYESDQPGAQLKQIKLPNGEQIHYSWNDTDKTHGADISMGSAAVRTRFDAERHITTITWGDRAP